MIYLKLLRISHWVKNLYIFAPLFFSGLFMDMQSLLHTIHAFVAFSLAASSIYIINDLKDRTDDAQHPIKKYRPLAAGKISPQLAISITLVLMIASSLLAWLTTPLLLYIVIGYVILNLAYTAWLKKIPIVDINVIAIGFVMRVFAGGISASVYVSHWLIIMVYLLSLFLAIAKRRDDLVLVENNSIAKEIRKSLAGYNIEFVNTSISVLSALMVVCYIMYITSAEVIERLKFEYAYFTLVFVLAGIFRYLQLTFIDKKSGSPTDVLIKDRFIQTTVVLWLLSFTYILYINAN